MSKHAQESTRMSTHMRAHLLRLPRNLHFKVHKVLHLPRNLRFKRKVLCLPRNLHFSRQHCACYQCCVCHENARSTKYCTCHEICASSAKCCACHEICTFQGNAAPATKSALQGPQAQSAAPATKMHFKVHKVLHLPRTQRIKIHIAQPCQGDSQPEHFQRHQNVAFARGFLRTLKANHMSKSWALPPHPSVTVVKGQGP